MALEGKYPEHFAEVDKTHSVDKRREGGMVEIVLISAQFLAGTIAVYAPWSAVALGGVRAFIHYS